MSRLLVTPSKRNLLLSLAIGLVLTLLLPAPASAQFATVPDYQFQSTSTMAGSGSLYSSAVVQGGTYTTYDVSQSQERRITPIRRARPGDPGEPLPIGDTLCLILFVLLAAIYRSLRSMFGRSR